ncbi:LysR family transcriptional regulator [Marinoscillum sp. MHG1-6]|uniref:LysR family transcriptional regulator n=1 Tax=Marinoscillum sp. MHG1-6 TaxID=2959627 RepID=UPI002157C4A0|nr:LysR family transcriptional regulator [Marinoscillum sp. MHG1-6]
MKHQYELRHLRYFMAIAEELNYRKAAEKLFISQPGLTRQIIQLEELLDAQLFFRDKKSVTLTDAGKYLFDQAQILFGKLEEIDTNVKLINKGDVGEVKVGYLGSAVQSNLVDLLVSINQRYSGIHTSLQEMNNHEQIERILHQQLDLGFVRMQQLPPAIAHKVVYEDTFSVVLPLDHSLDDQSFETMKQLEHERFIFFSSDYSPHYYEQILSICLDAGFQPRVSHKSVQAYTIFKMVESHLGIAIVPTVLQKGYDLGVKFIELSSIPQRTLLSAIWHKDNQKVALKHILELL